MATTQAAAASPPSSSSVGATASAIVANITSSGGSNKSNKDSKVSASNNNNDASDKHKKFENEGIVFKAKLIGSELVMEPRGDKMCQNSIQRLKAIIKGTNSHKRRIVLKISYDGVKVYDEKTNEILHHHEVSQISYIASDDTDNRTFGYVSDVPNKAHQFICFKTSGPAINVMSVISALFEAVLERKNQAEKAQLEGSTKDIIQMQDSVDLIGDSGIMDGDASILSDFTNDKSTSYSQLAAPMDKSTPYSQLATPMDKLAPFNQLAASLEKLTPYSQLGGSIDKSTPYTQLTATIDKPTPYSQLAAPMDKTTPFSQQAAPMDKSIPYSQLAAPMPIPERSTWSAQKDSHVDRYAVFNDIDTLPSIFESTSLGSVNAAAREQSMRNTMSGSGITGGGAIINPDIHHMNSSMNSRPSFHLASDNHWFSQSLNHSYLQQSSASNTMATGAGSSGGRTLAGTLGHSASMTDSSIFRRTNPFDDDFFA